MAHTFHNVSASVGETTSIRSAVILEKIMSPDEVYALCAENSTNGITAAGYAAFDNAMKTVLKKYFDKGLSLLVSDVLKTTVGVRGSFASLTGPWNPLVNSLVPSVSARGALRDYTEQNKGIFTPKNVITGLVPSIKTVYDPLTDLYDVATGTNPLTIGGINLTPDTAEEDEGVWFVQGTNEYKCTVTRSESLVVVASLPSSAPAGEGKLVVRTRCGQGETMGVSEASRIISRILPTA